MRSYYLLYSALAAAVYATVYAAAAHAFPEGPPPGHTGAMLGDRQQPDCSTCHFAGPDASHLSGLTLHGWPQTIEPNAVYELKLQLLDPEAKVGGFQVIIVNREGDSGRFTALEHQEVVSHDGIDYLGHTEPTSSTQDEQSGEMKVVWRVRWQAPAEQGIFSVFAAAVAADDDDSPLGDAAYTLSIQPE